MRDTKRLAIAVDDQTISLAWADQGGFLASVKSWPISRFATLTDALLTFEREAGVPLRGAECAIGILGAAEGETIMLSRGNWAISRSALRNIFDRDSLVINDVAARAWAVLAGTGIRREALSPEVPMRNFDRPGRWALTKIDSGVGLAIIEVNERLERHVWACEMGHCGFPPVTPEDRTLSAALATTPAKLVTWEMVLTLSLDDAVWATPGLPLTRSSRQDMLARLAGRYLGDVVLAHGAWAGACVTGRRGEEMLSRPLRAGFNGAFVHKPKFAKLIRATPRALVSGDAITLHGCAAAMNHRSGTPGPTSQFDRFSSVAGASGRQAA